jgi:hypothetical protein
MGIVSSMFIFSCAPEKPGNNRINYKLKMGQTVNIETPISVPFRSFTSQVIYKNDSVLLLRENRNETCIDIFDFEAHKYLRSIKLPSSGPNSTSIYSFIYHNEDTIFCIPLFSSKVSIFNYYGDFVSKKDLPIRLKYSEPNMFRASNQRLVNYSNNILSICAEPAINYLYESDKFHSDNIMMNYHLSKDTFWASSITFPYSYLGNFYPYHDLFRTFNENTQQYIFSFSYSHYLYLVDSLDNIDSVYIESSFLHKMPKFEEYDEPNRGKDCFQEKMYTNIIYDKYKNVYYRFLSLKGDEKYLKRIDITNEYLYRPFVVMLLDADFNLIDEMRLPEGLYNYYDIFLDKEGLWISANNPEDEEFDENQLKFSLITFELL